MQQPRNRPCTPSLTKHVASGLYARLRRCSGSPQLLASCLGSNALSKDFCRRDKHACGGCRPVGWDTMRHSTGSLAWVGVSHPKYTHNRHAGHAVGRREAAPASLPQPLFALCPRRPQQAMPRLVSLGCTFSCTQTGFKRKKQRKRAQQADHSRPTLDFGGVVALAPHGSH